MYMQMLSKNSDYILLKEESVSEIREPILRLGIKTKIHALFRQ